MSKKFIIVTTLLVLIAFAIPIEHKYDKLFRFYSLTLIPEGLEISKTYEKKIYFYVSDLISISLIFIALLWYRIPANRLFGNPLWFIFILSLASIAASPFFNYPIAYFRLLQLLTPFALFSFITTAFSDDEKPQITRAILLALVTAGLFQALIGIAQYFHQAPLGLRILGETSQSTIFIIKDGSRWLIDQLLQRPSDTTVVRRASGTLPHANVFGGLMLVSLLSSYALISRQKNWFLVFTLPIQLFAMSLSYSRSALFAWGISTFIWFSLNGLKPKRHQTIALVLAISLIFTATLLHNQYLERGGVIRSSPLSERSDNVRKIQQTTAIQIIKDHPLLGLGFSQFSERAQNYYSADLKAHVRATAPHNMFLFLACETGLLSVAALLIFIIFLLASFLRSSFSIESTTFASLLIGFLFIGFCDFYPILFQQGKLLFFLIASLLSLNLKMPREKDLYQK
jgi:O-antigen ligase